MDRVAKKYKIGTRGSLLAVTQSTLIKNQLEKLTGDSFELVTIKTEGDIKTSVPLWQLDGKDFFTKELDAALDKGEVDLLIHSYKDLGSDRPDFIKLAAVTERKFANDILLIKKKTIAELQTKKEFIVGTSSPRRIVNIEKNLNQFLPHFDGAVKTKVLRGNVNTRISKLQEDQYDAIVLAHAGLERLAQGKGSLSELTDLLKGLNFLILPQSIFPSSASQGALGIECHQQRNDNGELLEKLSQLNHEDTIQEVERERKSFHSYGGGCHLAVGINVKKWNDFYIHYQKGEVDNRVIDKVLFERPQPLPKPVQSTTFIGLPKEKTDHGLCDELIIKTPIQNQNNSTKLNSHVFVTSNYCLEQLKNDHCPETLWAAGSKTASALIKEGHWVNGSADGLGHQEILRLQGSESLKILMGGQDSWITLSYKGAASEVGETIGAYEKSERTEFSPNFLKNIQDCQNFFWTSFDQYQRYLEKFPIISNRFHACGLGKTYEQFQKHDIKVTPFVDLQSFIAWSRNEPLS